MRRRLRIANSGILAKPTSTNEEKYTVLLRTLLISPYKGVIHILSDPISLYNQVFSASTSFYEDLLCRNSSSYCGLLVRFGKNYIIGWHKQTFVWQFPIIGLAGSPPPPIHPHPPPSKSCNRISLILYMINDIWYDMIWYMIWYIIWYMIYDVTQYWTAWKDIMKHLSIDVVHIIFFFFYWNSPLNVIFSIGTPS